MPIDPSVHLLRWLGCLDFIAHAPDRPAPDLVRPHPLTTAAAMGLIRQDGSRARVKKRPAACRPAPPAFPVSLNSGLVQGRIDLDAVGDPEVPLNAGCIPLAAAAEEASGSAEIDYDGSSEDRLDDDIGDDEEEEEDEDELDGGSGDDEEEEHPSDAEMVNVFRPPVIESATPQPQDDVLLLTTRTSNLIMSGGQCIEIRDVMLPRGVYWLAVNGEIIGRALVEPIEVITTRRRWRELRHLHMWNIDFLPYSNVCALALQNIERLRTPIAFYQPPDSAGNCRLQHLSNQREL